MPSKIAHHLLVYLFAALVIVGLVIGTQFYVKTTRAKLAETKEAALAQNQLDTAAQLTKVKVVEILPIPFTDVLVLPGSIVASQDIDVASKLSGVIEWIGPKEGDRIKAKDKLLQVDVKSIKTQVAQVRAVYVQAQKDYERALKLFKDNIVSKNQLDSAKTSLDTSKAALDGASVSLSDGTLYAPAAGILDQLNVDVGEYLNPGQNVMKIVNIDQVFLELPVPEKDILYFQQGQQVDLEMDVTAQSACENPKDVEGQKQCWFVGTIDFMSLTADAATRTYLVKVLVDNANGILRPGMIVRAHLVRRKIEAAIAVPFFTIIDREKGKAVFVIENDTAVARPIEYGTFDKGLVEVRQGLQIGERLVIVGQRGLVDGQKVNVTDDLTPLAKQWLEQGKDLSDLPIDILK